MNRKVLARTWRLGRLQNSGTVHLFGRRLFLRWDFLGLAVNDWDFSSLSTRNSS
jgi:hypothetical protein